MKTQIGIDEALADSSESETDKFIGNIVQFYNNYRGKWTNEGFETTKVKTKEDPRLNERIWKASYS